RQVVYVLEHRLRLAQTAPPGGHVQHDAPVADQLSVHRQQSHRRRVRAGVDAQHQTAARHGLSAARRRTISPKIPLTNLPDSASPYFFASSTASLTATLSGMSGR